MIAPLYDLLTTFAIVFILLNIIGNSRKLYKLKKEIIREENNEKEKGGLR